MNSPLIKPLLFALMLAVPALADFTQADSAKASAYCKGGSFISTTILGKSPDNARGKAKAEIARSIISNIKSSTRMTDYSDVDKDGRLIESGKFSEVSEIESSLTLLGFQETETPKRQKNGEYELKAYICTKDAAKPFLERQRIVADSLSLASSTALGAKHPRQKNEAWHRAQTLWGEFARTRSLLEVLGTENRYTAEETYSKAREDYRNYCRNAKLHWNPEKKTPYSEIAFSKLSGGIKMEKSQKPTCVGKGISLVYKGTEPECSSQFGVNACSYAISLVVSSCDGTEYLQLKNETTGVHRSKEFALERLQDNLKSAEFWNEWLQEIKQWSPQCE